MVDAGFEIAEGIFSSQACDELVSRLSSELPTRSRAGARHLMGHPAVAALAKQEALLEIARRWVGAGAVPYRATLFDKSVLRNWQVVWHQDTALPLVTRIDSPEWGPWSVKAGVHYAHAPAWALSRIIALRVHLDPSTGENGPLKILPGSDRAGVLSDDEVFRLAQRAPPTECLVGRGGVLVMRPLLVHASSKARGPEPRRVIHLEYAMSLDLAPGLRLAVA